MAAICNARGKEGVLGSKRFLEPEKRTCKRFVSVAMPKSDCIITQERFQTKTIFAAHTIPKWELKLMTGQTSRFN